MPRLAGLQLLRALAALMVLTGHVIAEAEHYFTVDLAGDRIPWTRGVDIFFVISGFIITLSAARHADRPGAFLWRRLLRVAPLYYLFTTLMVAVLVLAPSAAKETELDPVQILSSYLFLPYERHDGRIAPVLSPGWTLNYEVFFYALAALALTLPRPFRVLAAALVTLSALSLLRPGNPALVFWTNPLILEFLFGIALARLWQRGYRRPSVMLALASGALGLVLLAALDSTPLPRFVAAGLPAALLVAAGTLFCPPGRLPLQRIGDASYALYLSHRFALRLLTLILLPALPPGAAWIYVALACTASIAVALITHIAVEAPLMRAFDRPARRGLPA
ncbi:acyltransferase [Ruegeria sediminis]|uniref:Acyltransferase n=1 Tax=Ruegeria sediminis TaxID=2583820 RepID=A0ABY2WUA6_9RHOB|nr:acyltransferase [Ruegeria sediminis]TMV05602.1 acyltransferase [Ruegeria sediminis]